MRAAGERVAGREADLFAYVCFTMIEFGLANRYL